MDKFTLETVYKFLSETRGENYKMKTRIRKLVNGKYVLEVKRFFWGWQGVDCDGMFEGRNMLFGLCRNLCWPQCWCQSENEAKGRKLNLYSYGKE